MTGTTPLNITDTQRANLANLADGLEANRDRIKFDMADFTDKDASPREAKCGSVGCIVGNAPHLGIAGFEALPTDVDWYDYSERLFARNDNTWLWLFNGGWADTDNTIEGAIKRIRWTLAHGLPVNWEDQLGGDEPLCYMEAAE